MFDSSNGFYNTDGRPLETILAEMRRAEIKIAKDHLEMATRGAWKSLVAKLRKRRADRETRRRETHRSISEAD